jgi:hypothetical protein
LGFCGAGLDVQAHAGGGYCGEGVDLLVADGLDLRDRLLPGGREQTTCGARRMGTQKNDLDDLRAFFYRTGSRWQICRGRKAKNISHVRLHNSC